MKSHNNASNEIKARKLQIELLKAKNDVIQLENHVNARLTKSNDFIKCDYPLCESKATNLGILPILNRNENETYTLIRELEILSCDKHSKVSWTPYREGKTLSNHST